MEGETLTIIMLLYHWKKDTCTLQIFLRAEIFNQLHKDHSAKVKLYTCVQHVYRSSLCYTWVISVEYNICVSCV